VGQSRARLLRAAGERDLDKLDEALFRAIHDEHLQLFDASSLTEWVGKNGGHAERFAAAYSSFGVNNQTVQAISWRTSLTPTPFRPWWSTASTRPWARISPKCSPTPTD